MNANELEIFCEVIRQACSVAPIDREACLAPHLDSYSLSAYADGLRYLARIGRVVIINQTGGRVIAKWIDEPKELNDDV